jgi:predicted TIM-barrel enzyme
VADNTGLVELLMTMRVTAEETGLGVTTSLDGANDMNEKEIVRTSAVTNSQQAHLTCRLGNIINSL